MRKKREAKSKGNVSKEKNGKARKEMEKDVEKGLKPKGIKYVNMI